MRHVGNMLEKDPDMYVIYFVRDPRSIVSSRLATHLMYRASARSPVKEAEYLCAKMMDDIRAYKRLIGIYEGALKYVRYEDLTENPADIIPSLYQFLNHSVPASVQDIIAKDHVMDGDMQKQKWRNHIPRKLHKAMYSVCSKVTSELGY